MFELSFLLLLILIFYIGFICGRYKIKSCSYITKKLYTNSLKNEYFLGLNYLLNEQTDEAIDSFIKVFKFDKDNLDINIILGRVFRQRGYIEKAINTHQNILAQPCLTKSQFLQVKLELAHDYLKAGLLDRAENLLIDLIKTNWCYKKDAINSLLAIYEQEKEWKEAINLIIEFSYIDNDTKIKISHYYSEIVDVLLAQKDLINVKKYLKRAVYFYKDSVRALLQMGRLEYEQNNYKNTIKILEKIAYIRPIFISESLSLLEKSYQKAGAKNKFYNFLDYCLKNHTTVSVIIVISKIILANHGAVKAYEFVLKNVKSNPTIHGVAAMIDCKIKNPDNIELQFIENLKDIINEIICKQQIYLCSKCGFEGKELYWKCPRCRVWDLIEPISKI